MLGAPQHTMPQGTYEIMPLFEMGWNVKSGVTPVAVANASVAHADRRSRQSSLRR